MRADRLNPMRTDQIEWKFKAEEDEEEEEEGGGRGQTKRSRVTLYYALCAYYLYTTRTFTVFAYNIMISNPISFGLLHERSNCSRARGPSSIVVRRAADAAVSRPGPLLVRRSTRHPEKKKKRSHVS